MRLPEVISLGCHLKRLGSSSRLEVTAQELGAMWQATGTSFAQLIAAPDGGSLPACEVYSMNRRRYYKDCAAVLFPIGVSCLIARATRNSEQEAPETFTVYRVVEMPFRTRGAIDLTHFDAVIVKQSDRSDYDSREIMIVEDVDPEQFPQLLEALKSKLNCLLCGRSPMPHYVKMGRTANEIICPWNLCPFAPGWQPQPSQ